MAAFAASVSLSDFKRFKDGIIYLSRVVIIGLIIITASLSSILYVGYNSLILQTQEFVHTLVTCETFPQSRKFLYFRNS